MTSSSATPAASAALLDSVARSLATDRVGTLGSPPLLLVHGLGSQKLMWEPVLSLLATSFDVAAVDLPGFGASPDMPDALAMTPRGFAEVLVAYAQSLGWSDFHVCGNSLGGWIALELAALNAVSSATALAPAGLWRRNSPLNSRIPIRLARQGAVHLSRALPLLEHSLVRKAALGALFGKPSNVPGEHAVAHARGFASCSGFARARHELDNGRFVDGQAITVPLTVVLSPRDPLIVRRQCDLSTLPAHTRVESPRGWGHIPTYDDPAGVARLIRETASVT